MLTAENIKKRKTLVLIKLVKNACKPSSSSSIVHNISVAFKFQLFEIDHLESNGELFNWSLEN